MIFKDWKPWSLIEYSKDKLLVTTLSNVLFLVHDFSVVKMIDDRSYDDSWKSHPLLLLNFDEDTFPFILLSGTLSLSIINIKTG